MGDSVTQGCFELFVKDEKVKPATRAKEGYVEKVKEIFELLYPTVPITIVNAGVSGDSAYGGLLRYKESLSGIFDKIKAFGAEVIFMTPSLKTDRLDVSMEKEIDKIAEGVAENERQGWLFKYIKEAKKICKDKNVPLCDCYEIWRMLRKGQVDINNLLSNRINHPIEKMHWMFAYELVKTMFEE